MPTLAPERLLSMAAFEAAHAVRHFRLRNPTLSAEQSVKTLQAIRADLYALDYEAGLTLEASLPSSVMSGPPHFFRVCIEAIIASERPFWIRMAPGGREQMMRAVPLNGVQCFRAAGLLDMPPDAEVLSWWDRLAAEVRADRDAALLAQGREAEWLSYQREVASLREMQISRSPVWASIDDNSLGYDILSYRSDGTSIVNRLIEVKSSTASPPRLMLTRNEWDTAAQYGHAIEFHLWTFPQRKLHIIPFAEMQKHIPLDQEAGVWMDVEITPRLGSENG